MRWPWQRMPSRDCATGDGAWPCASIRLVLPPEWPRPMPGVRHGTCTPPATAREVFQTTAAQGWPAAAGLPATGPGPASGRIRAFGPGGGVRRVHRHGGDAVLGRAVDEFVRVGQVDQRVAPGIDHAHDAQALEQYRHAFAGHLLLLAKRLGKADRPDLAASDGCLGAVFGQPQRALDAAGARTRDVAGHALHARVVIGFDDD